MRIQVYIDYTNHAGVRQIRHITPSRLLFAATEWHPEAQWMLDAYDIGKDDHRTFAVADIHRWSSERLEPIIACPPQYLHQPGGGRQDQIDKSIAKQLQVAMEANARMKNRLQKMSTVLSKEANPELRDVADDIDMVCKDEDPS